MSNPVVGASVPGSNSVPSSPFAAEAAAPAHKMMGGKRKSKSSKKGGKSRRNKSSKKGGKSRRNH
jgi:hypothetical protein